MSHKPKQRNTETFRSRLMYCEGIGDLVWKDGPKKGKPSGWLDPHGYRLTRINKELLRNHHIIWFLCKGEWPDKEVDHKDNNPSNNRIENLRLADRPKQGANQNLQSRRKGKWKGVHPSGSGKYYIKIKHKGETIKGLPANVECAREAAMIYNMWAEKLFGPYANFNQVFD